MGSSQSDVSATQTQAPVAVSNSSPAVEVATGASVSTEVQGFGDMSAAAAEVSSLKAKIASLEGKVESLISSISNGLHNRVNDIENTIKRKFPYG